MKFIFESIEDYLKPKSKREIDKDLLEKNKKDVNDLFVKASIQNNIFIVQKLFNKTTKYAKEWALCTACSNKDALSVVKFLIENNVDINCRNDYPLRISCFFGCDKIVNFLLENGANPNTNNNYKKSLTYFKHIDYFNRESTYAIRDAVKGLINYHPDIQNLTSTKQKTNIVKSLLNYGANKGLTDALYEALNYNKTFYIDFSEIIYLLLQYIDNENKLNVALKNLIWRKKLHSNYWHKKIDEINNSNLNIKEKIIQIWNL